MAVAAGAAFAQDATAMHDRYSTLTDKLASNVFQRPLDLEAAQSSGDLKGDVYARVDYAYGAVLPALTSIDHWCDILILHLNVKQCRTAPGQLVLNVGRKFDQPLADTYKLDFVHKVVAAQPDYLQVQLSAEEGPFSTHNYRINVEAIPIDAKHSFIHMSYAYGYGFAARMAMQAYFATAGRDKTGFTVTGKKSDGTSVYVGGTIGLLERNTMRYYLAIDAYLGSLALPPADQTENRIRTWYRSTEQYAQQLHEMDQTEYLDMKRSEIARMKSSAGPVTGK